MPPPGGFQTRLYEGVGHCDGGELEASPWRGTSPSPRVAFDRATFPLGGEETAETTRGASRRAAPGSGAARDADIQGDVRRGPESDP